jgi:hypothetical protein
VGAIEARRAAGLAAAAPPVKGFAGAAACRPCHVAETLAWQAGPHAGALSSLVAAGRAGDRACLACHATGAGQPGGFVSASATPALSGVQCESCHGTGVDHAASGGREPLGPAGATGACETCHDDLNDPGFDPARDLALVRHGGLTRGPGGEQGRESGGEQGRESGGEQGRGWGGKPRRQPAPGPP